MNKTKGRGTEKSSEKPVQESRRKFLEQAGKLAVYTPPSMMLLMKPSSAFTILSGNGIPICEEANGVIDCRNGEYTGNAEFFSD